MDTGGFHSGSLAVGDFNDDGFPDIAVSNEMSNTISVFLNDGKGNFSNPIITPVQISALNVGPIAAGDLNEDGRADLVLGTIGGSEANIALLSNGNGTFTQLPPISNSFGFIRARLVDLNSDKHLDLVAGGNGNMAVALGNGDGTFSSMTYLDNGPMPDTYFGIDVGDVNGDGKLDIVGLNFGYGSGDIVVFLGNGDGTFQSPISQPRPLPVPLLLQPLTSMATVDSTYLSATIRGTYYSSPETGMVLSRRMAESLRISLYKEPAQVSVPQI
jgi:hypothetical protein